MLEIRFLLTLLRSKFKENLFRTPNMRKGTSPKHNNKHKSNSKLKNYNNSQSLTDMMKKMNNKVKMFYV